MLEKIVNAVLWVCLALSVVWTRMYGEHTELLVMALASCAGNIICCVSYFCKQGK